MKNLFTFLCICIIVSCSSDSSDSEIGEETQELPFAVTAISKDGFDEIQVDIDKNGNVSPPINLTEELGLSQYIKFRYFNDLITYTQFTPINSFWHKNIKTGEIEVGDPFCIKSELRPYQYVATSKNYTAALTFVSEVVDEPVYRTFSIDLYDHQNEQCSSIPLGFGFFDKAAIFENTLVVDGFFANDDASARKLFFIDLTTRKIYGSLDSSEYPYVTAKGDLLYIFTTSVEGIHYEVRSLSNLELQNTITIKNATFLDFTDTFFYLNQSGTKAEFQNGYGASFAVKSSPVILDISSGQVIRDNDVMFEVRKNLLEEQSDFRGSISTYSVDVGAEIIAVGFSRSSLDNPNRGGVAFTNFDGDILAIVELDYLPKNIIIRN